MKKWFILCTLFLAVSVIQCYAAIPVAYRIHNTKGERVGTCRHDTKKPVYYLYDMNNQLVKNPAKFMNQPANECYLFDVDGIALGKCTATRVILWGR